MRDELRVVTTKLSQRQMLDAMKKAGEIDADTWQQAVNQSRLGDADLRASVAALKDDDMPPMVKRSYLAMG